MVCRAFHYVRGRGEGELTKPRVQEVAGLHPFAECRGAYPSVAPERGSGRFVGDWIVGVYIDLDSSTRARRSSRSWDTERVRVSRSTTCLQREMAPTLTSVDV